MAKQEVCCARLTSRLRAARGELQRLARLEAYHAQKSHRNERLPGMIRDQKAEIARIQEQINEHEAEHAA